MSNIAFDLLAPPSRAKLLVVDDQPLNCVLLMELFSADFDLFSAKDGYDAIEKTREIKPDLILLDVVMPSMDGYEVCKILKSDPDLADIPIIFLTAHFDDEEEVRGLNLGAVDYIHKPINYTITKARITNQLIIKHQKEMLHAIANLDGLTGIANRRKFDDYFISMWLQCARMQMPLSLLIIDIDYFKQFNDRYGHHAGDVCLKSVAQTIQLSLRRPCDLAARYGGEEFSCVLPQTDLAGATYVANKILENIINLKIPHFDSNLTQILTVSIGVSTLIPSTDTIPTSLIDAADQQLYEAKHNGRSRVSSKAL